MNCLDFNESYLSWETNKESIGRFTLDSRYSLRSGSRKPIETYYLASGVMAGNVYATSDLPKEPVYMFQIVASHNDFTIFRDFEMDGKCDDTVESILVHFKSLHIAAKETQGRVLSRVEDVFLAVQNNRRLIANVMLEFGEHVVDLHFPVKHINIQINGGRFQVETGPVAVPLALFFKHKVNEADHDKVGRAYVFINDYHKAEFLLQSVIVNDGRLSRKYSQTVAYHAATTLIEIE